MLSVQLSKNTSSRGEYKYEFYVSGKLGITVTVIESFGTC